MAEDELVEIVPNMNMEQLNFISVIISSDLYNPEITSIDTFLLIMWLNMWTDDRGISVGSFLRFRQRCLCGLQWHWRGEENAPSGLRGGCLLVRQKMHN